MINPILINKVGDTSVWEITVTNGLVDNTNVVVDLILPTEFTIQSTNVLVGSVTGNQWVVGPMTANSQHKIIVVVELTSTPASSNEVYNFQANVTADFDTEVLNNTLTDTLEYKLETLQPLGGAVNDKFCCEIDLAANDTECTEGITEWRIDPTVVNGEILDFDVLTGKGTILRYDPTLPTTGTYKLYCVVGVDELEVACDVTWEKCPLFRDKTPFNHTLCVVTAAELTVDQLALLTAQHPDVDISVFGCWYLLKNGDGEVTSGLPLNCDDTVDDDGSIIFINGSFDLLSPETGVTFPTDPEESDVVTAIFNDAVSYFNFDGTSWVYLGSTTDKDTANIDLRLNGNVLELEDSEGNVLDEDLGNIPAISALAGKVVTGFSVDDPDSATKVLRITFADTTFLEATINDNIGGSSVDWSNITNIPADILDGDDDTISTPHPVVTLNTTGTDLQVLQDGVVVGSVPLSSLGVGGDDWGTQTVASDSTLNGDGDGTPLSVADPFPGFTDLPTDYGVTLHAVATSGDYDDLSNKPTFLNKYLISQNELTTVTSIGSGVNIENYIHPNSAMVGVVANLTAIDILSTGSTGTVEFFKNAVSIGTLNLGSPQQLVLTEGLQNSDVISYTITSGDIASASTFTLTYSITSV